MIVLEKRSLPFRIRQSLLEDAKCLHRLKAHYVDKRIRVDNEFTIRGTHVHDLHELYVNHLVATQQESDYEQAEQLTKGDWNRDAVRLFREWYRRETFDPARIFGCEVDFALDWDFRPVGWDPSDPNIFATMKVDRLEMGYGEAEIIDLKTHFAAFQPDTIQSKFYPWLLWKTYPALQKITFTLDFVRWGIKRSREFTPEDLEEYENDELLVDLKRLMAAVDTGEWPALPNAKCSVCTLDCPLVEAGVDRLTIGQVQTEAEAIQMASELYAMQQAAAKLGAVLKVWVAERGHIQLPNEIELGYRRRSKAEYDPRKVNMLNAEYGFEPLRALRVNPFELKKIAKRYPEFVDRLDKAGGKKDASTTEFRFMKTKDTDDTSDTSVSLPFEEEEPEWA